MRFLLDVHIASSIGHALAGEGHDVLRASDDHADWADLRLLDLAMQQDGVLITEDRDFSELIYRDNVVAPPAVLYIRCEPADQPGMAERLLLVIANTDIDGHMVVVQRASVRYRPLREQSNDNA